MPLGDTPEEDNAKGYTVENVAVICFRCNVIKRDAAIGEIENILAYMRVPHNPAP